MAGGPESPMNPTEGATGRGMEPQRRQPNHERGEAGRRSSELVQPKGWRSRKESLARPRTRSGVMAR